MREGVQVEAVVNEQQAEVRTFNALITVATVC